MSEEEKKEVTEEVADVNSEEQDFDPEKMPNPMELLSMMFAGMSTKQLTGFMLSVYAEKAWENMGIKLPYGEKEPKKDMASAKVAIDTVLFMFEQIKADSNPEEVKMVENLISNLQINFVKNNQ